MKTLITTSLLFFSFSSFGSSPEVSTLTCSVKRSYLTSTEKQFKLTLKFKPTISAVNNSGLAKTQIADIAVTHSVGRDVIQTISLKDISIQQETRFYGYELLFVKTLLGSAYDSFLSLAPRFQGNSVKSYDGRLELNGMVNGNDAMIMKTEDLSCVVNQ
jgi:hypothetical protein